MTGEPWMPNLEPKLALAPPSVDRAELRRWEERLCGHVREHTHDGRPGLICSEPPPDHRDALAVYADWLEESGWPEFAAAVRESLAIEFGGAYLSGWLWARHRELRLIEVFRSPS